MLASPWRAHRPPPSDVLLAAGFVLLGQAITWWELEGPDAHHGDRAPNAVLSALFLAALAWRRRAPLAAVGWAVAVFLLPSVAWQHDVTFWGGGVPLMLMTASAGYYCTRRRAVGALALALAGFAVLSLTTPEFRSVSALIWNLAFLTVPWIGARALRERESRVAALAAALATERAAKDAALREAAADERAHIARELHDIVAHSVSMMIIQIGAARMQLGTATGAAAATGPLLDAEDVGRQTLADLRRLLGVLRTETGDDAAPGDGTDAVPPPQPGLGQLEALVRPLRAAGVQVQVDVAGEAVPLPATLDLTAYRIVQEALTNTLKHSGARRATVGLRYTPAMLLIDVADDGRAAPMDAPGHGLLGIRERVALFGGSVTAGPGLGGGWRVQAELPLPMPLPLPTSQEQRAAALPAS